ncbi:MAG: hypothetical protein CMK09_12840 [Ponticaulis sp.]|nr:hypothetical protein [Ponticaulis sp.]|tara:strand:- start:45531 stop:45728 length:198 start_codon:yes stop_codon:yes gene_type:complete
MRKLVAGLVILTFLAVYIVIAATIGSMLVSAPRWLQLVYYAIAGIIWAFPLKPLFTWVNAGASKD